MKKALLSSILVLGGVLAYNASYNSAHSNSPGAPVNGGVGYTGSPADGRTCGTNGGCHGGGSTNMPNWVTSDIPATGYIPGETYSISATVEENGITVFGFQLSPQNATGTVLGDMTPVSGATKLLGNGNYITHVLGSTIASNSKTWTFDWTAPVVGSGDVTFYAAFNAANGNGNFTGDNIYESSLSVSEDPSVGIGILGSKATASLSVYPNPASETATIAWESASNGAVDISVMDLQGRLLTSKKVQQSQTNNHQLSLEDYTSGIYIVRLTDGTQTATSRLVIE